MRARRVVLVVLVGAVCAGCSTANTSGSSQPQTRSTGTASPLHTSVTSVTATSQLSEMVQWTATNKTSRVQLATCEVLVLKGSTQLGDAGPTQIAVAAGATAQQYSEVDVQSGSTTGATAQIVCQQGWLGGQG